jgi:hypothetical protein
MCKGLGAGCGKTSANYPLDPGANKNLASGHGSSSLPYRAVHLLVSEQEPPIYSTSVGERRLFLNFLQRAPSAELESKSADVSLVPAEWSLAWEEFGWRYPRMKRGALLVNALIFNGTRLSILAIPSFLYGWLPWWAFALMLLSTLALSQMFVIRFAGLAHKREKDALREQLQAPRHERRITVCGYTLMRNVHESRIAERV